VLQWDLPGEFTRRLIDLDVFLVPARTIPCSDLVLIRNWVEMLKKHGDSVRDILLLEIESRLRWLALETGHARSGSQSSSVAMPSGKRDRFEQIVGMIARQYGEKLSVAQIAEAVGLHRNHVMRLFRQMTGMSVLEYITHHRVCHAQRLLATTDMKIIDAGHEAGFNSPTRFYAMFQKTTGQSPGQYRRSLRTPDRRKKK
jgi:AraC family transcriptional regulator, melibiose operon regulatory protein